METIQCNKCGAVFEKTGVKDKLRRFKDKRFMKTFHCPNCDARVILKNGEEPITIYLKRLERLKEQARRLGDRQEVNELQDEIDQINREIKMNAGKTKDKKFSMKGNDAYDPTKPKNIAKAKALSVAQGKAASDAKVEVKQQSDVGSNQWGIYVDGKLVEGGFFSKSAAEEASVQYSKDEAYDPLDPENIAEEKELAKARGAAAADEKIISINTPKWSGDIKIVDNTHFEMKAEGTNKWSWAYHIGQADDHILNALKAKGMLKDNGRFFITDSLFKGQKVTAIKSEQGLREGETYTVLGEEVIIKQVVGEGNTIVYKLQDSSGNVIVIESPEGLFYEVKDGPNNSMIDAYDDGYKAAKNDKPISDNPFKDRSRSGWGDFKESWDDGWRNGNKNKDSKTKDKEEENESLKVKIGDIRKNMDAARKMGYDTEPYQKEIDKLETKDEWTEEEIKKRMKRISEEIDKIVLSGGVVGLGDPLSIEYGRLKSKLKNKTKDDNSKNGYYAAMTGKARTDNPFPKGTPENQKWDSDWKIGSEDFKYESNKELFKPKDSDDKELKEMLVNDAPDYYGAIVATARRGNNPQMGSKEVRKNLEPFMAAHGVQFNEEEFNKAYKEFSHAGVSKAAFMKGTDSKTKDRSYREIEREINILEEKRDKWEELEEFGMVKEANKKLDILNKELSATTDKDSKTKDADPQLAEKIKVAREKLFEASKAENKRKPGGEEARIKADKELSILLDQVKDSSDFYTKDPLTKKGEKILAVMKKVYGEEKGEQIFYASRNKGKISGVDKKTKDDNLPADYLDKLEKEIRDIIKANGDKEKAKKLLHELENTGANKFPDLHKALDADYKIKECPNCKNQLTYAGEDNGKVKYKCELCGKSFVSKDSKTKDDYKRMTLAELQKKAKEGYFELQSDPKPRNHVEIKYPDGKKEWVFVEDQEIKIIIGGDPVNPSPAEQKVEGNDVIYKEYTLKQLPETGEFEIYAPGGSIVGHAKALKLAKLFVDRIVVSRVGDEWSEEARKKL